MPSQNRKYIAPSEVNPNFTAEWTDEEFANILARMPRRARGLRVAFVTSEAPGSAYLDMTQGAPGRHRGFGRWLMERWLI